MKNKLLCTLILTLASFQSSFSEFVYSKEEKEIIQITPSSNEAHHNTDNINHYDNILGYKKNDYLLLYGNQKAWLYNMEGKELLSWKSNIKRAELLKNCNLMVIEDNQNDSIIEKNFDGLGAWDYQVNGMTHHDFDISNHGENITFFYRKVLPEDFELKNDCKNSEVLTDCLIEVTRTGEKVFEWCFHNHYPSVLNKRKCDATQKEHQAKSNYSKNLLDWVHPNAVNIIKDNKWYRKGYKEFKPGNLLVTIHHLSRVIIIDKDTSKVVWIYNGGNIPLQFPHEADMITEGLPGAGNILIFDNGPMRKYTRVIEINPINKKVIWSYSNPGEFYSKWSGSQQRLKNGDTFISDDVSGRVFIVNKKGDIKWQFTPPNSKSVKRAKLYLKKDFAHCLPES